MAYFVEADRKPIDFFQVECGRPFPIAELRFKTKTRFRIKSQPIREKNPEVISHPYSNGVSESTTNLLSVTGLGPVAEPATGTRRNDTNRYGDDNQALAVRVQTIYASQL
jgi:hypothetical protein